MEVNTFLQLEHNVVFSHLYFVYANFSKVPRLMYVTVDWIIHDKNAKLNKHSSGFSFIIHETIKLK